MHSTPLIGIALALASAVALAIGNMLQARGVKRMEGAASVDAGGVSKALKLLHSRWWLLGAALLGLSILFQMGSLAFAPLIVVQPLGVVALVITVIVTSLVAHQKPSSQVIRSIAICVIGVGAFVTVAALVSTQHAITSTQLVAVLVVLCCVLAATGLIWVFGRKSKLPSLLWVLLGGIYSAFVATLGKTVILRVQTAWKSHDFDLNLANLLTIGCLIGIAVAGALSVYFVQRSHVDNRPEVVVAGLTVIDPTVAVVLSITILGEASAAPAWAILAFIVAGAVSMYGVYSLSKAEGATAFAGSRPAPSMP